MIQDLKADSARWEQERRASARNAAPGAGGSREQPRGGPSDYSSWKNRQREQQEYDSTYASSAMDIDYNTAPPSAPPPNPHYAAGQGYPGAPPPQGYPQAAYPPPIHPPAPQYQPAQAYGYPPNPPGSQYSPGPQQSGDRFMAPPPPIQGSFPAHPQDAGFIHGSNYSSASGYATAGQPRMPPLPMTSVSAPPRTTYSVPSGPPYGPEGDYGYAPPAGNPAPQAFPSDPLYGRGAYATTTKITHPPEASSDELGSPAGTTPRQGFGAAPEPPFDDHSSPVPSSAATIPTTTATTPSSNAGSAAGRRERDSEPRDRDMRDHRQRRDQERVDDRHRNRHHRPT
jgi:hypothetical protein